MENPMNPTELTELDRLLAFKVIGVFRCTCKPNCPDLWLESPAQCLMQRWHPTTDVAQAMMVAQRISDKGWIVLTLTYEHHERVPQGCVIIKGCAAPFPLPEIVKHPVYFDDAIFQQSETLPLAICLAARAWLEAAAQPTAPRE